jgi:hypothetical protein
MGKTRILYVTTKHFAGLSRDGQSWSLALVRRHLVSRHFCLATLTGFRKPVASQLILVKTGKPAGLVLLVEIIFFNFEKFVIKICKQIISIMMNFVEKKFAKEVFFTDKKTSLNIFGATWN